MKVAVEFTCPKCGLWTPGFAEFPDDVDRRRMAHLAMPCFHCDQPMEMKETVAKLIAKEKAKCQP